jgi:hypothetical protein
MSKMMIGTAGLAAALTIASPAAAQQPYPYNNQNTGVVGAIVNAVTGNGYNQYPQGAYGYGQYPQGNYGYAQTNQRNAVGMCAAAAEQRISATYRGQPGYGYNNGYNNGYANNGYQQGYANGYNGQIGRVLGITNVERRNNGSLKVSGVASSGRGYGYNGQGYNNQGYYNQGYNNGYNGQNAYANQAADLRFTCKVNTRGQVTDVNINRNQVAYRGY